MNTENSTVNPTRLSLAERAALDLLATEPALLLSELLELEHSNQAARMALKTEIDRAIEYKVISAVREPCQNEPGAMVIFLFDNWRIDRESYHRWRAQCPKSLLSDLSHIGAWLGATPALAATLPAETSLPKLPGPARLTESQQDKQDCQAIARELWAEHPDWIQADLLKNSRIKPYLNKWPGKNTVPGWLSAVDPRTKEQRRGRPAKAR